MFNTITSTTNTDNTTDSTATHSTRPRRRGRHLIKAATASAIVLAALGGAAGSASALPQYGSDPATFKRTCLEFLGGEYTEYSHEVTKPGSGEVVHNLEITCNAQFNGFEFDGSCSFFGATWLDIIKFHAGTLDMTCQWTVYSQNGEGGEGEGDEPGTAPVSNVEPQTGTASTDSDTPVDNGSDVGGTDISGDEPAGPGRNDDLLSTVTDVPVTEMSTIDSTSNTTTAATTTEPVVPALSNSFTLGR